MNRRAGYQLNAIVGPGAAASAEGAFAARRPGGPGGRLQVMYIECRAIELPVRDVTSSRESR